MVAVWSLFLLSFSAAALADTGACASGGACGSPSAPSVPRIEFPAGVTRVMLDVGASTGSRSYPRLDADPSLGVVAFEPLLVEVRVMNEKRHPRMIVMPVAISTVDGASRFYMTQNRVSSSLHPVDPVGFGEWVNTWPGSKAYLTEGLKASGSVWVPTMRLEHFIRALPFDEVEYMKIDAQGHDLDVCATALGRYHYAGATWPGHQTLDDVITSGAGYTLAISADPLVYDASVSAAAGDVDGDSVGDVVTAGHGAIHVVLGPLSQRTRLATSPGHRIDAPQCAGGAASVAVASAGDVDGDGLGDIVAVCGGGRAYVVLGRVRGAAAAAAWPRDTYSVGNATRSFAVVGAGAWAAGVGDVNGDKCGDLAVARADGQVAVLLGRRGAAWPDVVDVSAAPSLFPFGGFVVRGAERMGGAGDVNGDGVGDLVVGSALLSPGGRYRAGSAFVVFGRASFGETLDLSRDSGVVAVEGEREGDMAGMSVSGAGDIDSDGAPDVIVGLPSRLRVNYARYFVVFGSRNSSAVWPRSLVVSTAPQAASAVRTCLVYANALAKYKFQSSGAVASSRAGDVNGDGIDDVVLCHTVPSVASQCTALLGASGQWPSTLVADSPTEHRSLVMHSQTTSLLLGRSVGALGDIDDDGLDDVLMGAPDDDSSSLGCTYILRGHKWNVSALPSNIDLDLAEHQGTGYILLSQTTAPQVGASVHGVGDINNDGRADFAVGAPGAGRVFLRFGAVGPVEPESSIEAGSVVLESSEAWDMFGWSVSSAGDINGDGVADLVVGAPGADSGVGRAYIVFGRSGFWAPGAVVDVANLSSEEGIVISGDKEWPGCGYQVSSAGDMNKDGVDDLIVGAVRTTGIRETVSGGRVYVVLGSKQLGNVNVSGLDGRNGFSVDNAVQSGSPSFVLAGIGDVNGDGVNDAAFGSSAPVEESGWAVHVLFGKNGQWGPSVDVRSLDGINGFTVTSNQTDSRLFPTLTVGSAGDLNNDSVADIVLGTFLGSYILFGRGGSDDMMTGVHASLSHVGDANGDMVDDLLIGTPDVDGSSGSAVGKAYSFTVPADVAFSQADGKKLSLKASGVEHYDWRWLSFIARTNTFTGTPDLKGTVAGVNTLLSSFVFKHFMFVKSVDFTVRATDGFGDTCETKTTAKRNAEDEDDFGIDLNHWKVGPQIDAD
eukprot:m51a1_g7231 hypothetical protein (1169) ;mRNA; f:37105-43453